MKRNRMGFNALHHASRIIAMAVGAFNFIVPGIRADTLMITAFDTAGNLTWVTDTTGGTIMVETSCNLNSEANWTVSHLAVATSTMERIKIDLCNAPAYYRLRYIPPRRQSVPSTQLIYKNNNDHTYHNIGIIRPIISNLWLTMHPEPFAFTNAPGSVDDLDDLRIAFETIRELDRDGDGMPDWWEMRYGLNPHDPADAWEDPDNDGLINLYEYRGV